ncbi:hypothetical protein WNY37_12270 [Henriciella sp. AS95]|uniref:hypothetical protein n=1 Tax=Henriciella sp. AS95 TaxID=3135782 RepID=UPI003174D989
MRLTVSALAVAAMVAVGPVATAQNGAATPKTASEKPLAPAAMSEALAGFHVAILRDDGGGIASVGNGSGQAAVVTFLEPAAAEKAQAALEGETMSVDVVPLAAIMNSWAGPVVFEASAAEVAKAKEVGPEGVEFVAPVFFVTTDGKETMMKTPTGDVTPILPSYQNATQLAKKLADEGIDESTIEIVPIELAAVLRQISTVESESHYRVFTHPETVAMIEAKAKAARSGDG